MTARGGREMAVHADQTDRAELAGVAGQDAGTDPIRGTYLMGGD